MAAANGVPTLWQFRASHFNEKVRWALDWKGIRHRRRSLLPGPHVPVVLWLTGQKSVPVLQLDGETIADSTRIIAALERRHPERPLYPADDAARRRALELEELFDDEIGVHLRRVLFHLVLPDTRFAADLMTPGFPAVTKTIYAALFPLTRAVMRIDMGITDDGAARSLVRFEAALERLEQEIGPSGYLVGDGFSVADLTAAALLSPLTFPPEYPYALPPLPRPAREF
jgi:glutathione S-transferase